MAEWIAWQLKAAGYTTIIQAWDFHAGGNFILDMDQAAKTNHHTLAVLSPGYLASLYTQPEWASALVQASTSSKASAAAGARARMQATRAAGRH